MEILIDTSVYLDLLGGRVAAKERLADCSRAYFSVITLGEVWSGLPSGEEAGQRKKTFQAFYEDNGIDILPVTRKTAEHYAHIFRWLKNEGTSIPANDIWIAAVAAEHGLALATSDRHFKHIPHIQLV